MSTICVGHKIFMAVYEKAIQYKTKAIVSYYTCFCLKKITNEYLAEWVQTLSRLNERTYREAYGDRVSDQIWEHIYLENLTPYDCGEENIDVYQMLKYLHGIHGNINASLADQKEEKHLALLDKVIYELMNAIITTSEEYNKARWV